MKFLKAVFRIELWKKGRDEKFFGKGTKEKLEKSDILIGFTKESELNTFLKNIEYMKNNIIFPSCTCGGRTEVEVKCSSWICPVHGRIGGGI